MIPEYIRSPPSHIDKAHSGSLSSQGHPQSQQDGSSIYPLQPDPFVHASYSFHNPYLSNSNSKQNRLSACNPDWYRQIPQNMPLHNPQQLQQQNSFYIATPHYTHGTSTHKYPHHSQMPPRHDSISSTSSNSSIASMTSSSASSNSSMSSACSTSPTHLHIRHHQQHQRQQPQHAAALQQSPNSSASSPSSSSSSQQGKKRRGNLPKPVTDILRNWLNAHVQHPYPTDEEKAELMKQTGLTLNQISNWFINARRRRLPAMNRNKQ